MECPPVANGAGHLALRWVVEQECSEVCVGRHAGHLAPQQAPLAEGEHAPALHQPVLRLASVCSKPQSSSMESVETKADFPVLLAPVRASGQLQLTQPASTSSISAWPGSRWKSPCQLPPPPLASRAHIISTAVQRHLCHLQGVLRTAPHCSGPKTSL